MSKVRNEEAAVYQTATVEQTADAAVDLYEIELSQLVAVAKYRLQGLFEREGFNSPKISADFLTLEYSQTEREIFGVIWLDQQNRFIAKEELFMGTVNQSSVHVREVLKAGLAKNAAACVFYHNHPSGRVSPSQADFAITKQLKEYLDVVDIRTLDHIVVGGGTWHSMAQAGEL